MSNFCQNCGIKLKSGIKFCSSCGKAVSTPLFQRAVSYWSAKEVDTGDDYRQNTKGSLALSQEEIIFYKDKFLSSKTKEWRRIPIKGIKSIYRTPIFNLITIKYNRKPEKTGFWSKLFNKRNISYKVSNWKSFLENIQRLGPNIKIKY